MRNSLEPDGLIEAELISLSDPQSELPFITFPEFKPKCLIDTGRTRSFITPAIAEKFFRRSIEKDPFKISSAHGTSIEQYSITIPSSKIFNLPDVNLKFHLFKFHQHFDCLLGLDNLKLLNSNIDLQKNLLVTPRVHIPFQYHKINSTNISTNFITIVTDHKPLQWLFSVKDPSSKTLRWRLKLEEHDSDIVYKKATLNKNAEFLSRIEINANETNDSVPTVLADYIKQFNEEFNREQNNPGPSTSIQPCFDNRSLLAEPNDLDHPRNAEEDNDQTIHFNHENPLINISIIDTPVNFGKNQIIISEVNFDPTDPIIVNLHKNKQSISVQISKNHFENDTIQFLKA
nr:unnamed protein product [Callosobruchus chinensis]